MLTNGQTGCVRCLYVFVYHYLIYEIRFRIIKEFFSHKMWMCCTLNTTG